MNMPSRIAVIGGGRMGAGIAHAFIISGCPVTLIERSPELAEAARERVAHSCKQSVTRGATSQSLNELLDLLETTEKMNALAGCELVIEAVFEDPGIKRETLLAAESLLSSEAALASNTSSISIDRLAADLARPHRFLGLHFFNPVPASKLVEVVLGTHTGDDLAEAARAWTSGLGKRAVTVRDSPGFASSRLGVALGLEAMRMVEEDVASAEDIDAAMEMGYRHPMGPLRTSDVVGLDVRLGIAEELHRELGERFAPPEILRRMVAEGKLGQKTGQGFYEWSER